jgi:uncharacterized protein YkwD
MFRHSTRHSPFWAAAALLALLAAPHTLLAQDAPPTVRADVTNWTGRPVEFALVGPDGKDFGPPHSVQYRYVYRSSNRALPGGSAGGYKWVVRDQATGKVLREVPANNYYMSIKVGLHYRSGEVPKETGSAQTPKAKGQGDASGQTVRADVNNQTGSAVEFALVGPDGKDLGPARSVQSGKGYQTGNRTLPGGSARGYKWVVRDPGTGRVLQEVPADRAQQSITVGITVHTNDGRVAFGLQPRRVVTAKEVLRFVNEERKQRGLAPLVEDIALTWAAQKYTHFMAQHHNNLVNGPQKLSDSAARSQTLSHKLDGKEPFQRAKAEGFPHMDVAEVAHAGPYVNAEQAVRAPDGVGWINSKAGHREAILSSKYTLAGVGVAYTGSGVPYYVMKLASPR